VCVMHNNLPIEVWVERERERVCVSVCVCVCVRKRESVCVCVCAGDIAWPSNGHKNLKTRILHPTSRALPCDCLTIDWRRAAQPQELLDCTALVDTAIGHAENWVDNFKLGDWAAQSRRGGG
jgi:hypothetical protein